MTDVRVRRQAGFDRVTFVFSRTVPGYEVRYVREVIKGPSDEKVRMPGRAYLEILFSFAGSERNQDLTTKLRPDPHRVVGTGYPALEAYIMSTDHHGVMTFALGLTHRADFRVAVRNRTVQVDVRHP